MQLRNPLMSGLTFPPPGFPTAEAMAQFFACFQAAQQHAQQPPALPAQQQAVQQHAAQQQAAQQHAAQPPALLEQQHAQQYAAQQHAAQQHAAQQHTAQQHAAQQHAAQQHATQQQVAQQQAAQQHAVQQHAAQQLAAQQHAVQQQASQQQAALLAQQQAAPAQPQDMPAGGAQQPADVFTRAAPRTQPALEAPHEHSLLRVVLEQAAHQQQQLSVVQESLALLRARMPPLPETVLPSASVVPQSQTWLTQSWPAYATQTQPEGVRLQRGPSMHWDATVSPTGPRPWGGLVNQTTGTSVPQRVDAQPDGARPLRGLLTRWGSSAVDAIGPRTSRWGRPMDPITTGASVLPSRSLQRAVSFMSRTACRNGAGCDVDDCGFDHTPRSVPIVQAKNASPASRRSSPSAAATAKPRTATLKPSNKELPVPSAPSAKMLPTATKPGSAYIDGPLPSKTEHDAHRLVNAKSMAAFYEDLADKAVALAHAHGRWAARLENRIASAAASPTAPVAEADAVSPAHATAPARNTMAPIPRTKGTQRSDATAAAALLRAAAKAAEAERAQKERAATEERDRNDSAALAAAAAENDAAKAAAQATAHASEEKAAAEKVTAAATAAAATAAAATAAAATAAPQRWPPLRRPSSSMSHWTQQRRLLTRPLMPHLWLRSQSAPRQWHLLLMTPTLPPPFLPRPHQVPQPPPRGCLPSATLPTLTLQASPRWATAQDWRASDRPASGPQALAPALAASAPFSAAALSLPRSRRLRLLRGSPPLRLSRPLECCLRLLPPPKRQRRWRWQRRPRPPR